MKIKRVVLVLLILFLLILPLFLADNGDQYHLKLLAVQESAAGLQGSDADLYLELKEGSGRVFLETFPLTKMDTQISTRFAKEIACKHFKLNCHKYDFIFTIKAKSNIIGGPSAGAAISALTTIAMLDLDYDKKVSITGTINSGGIIGTVGGIKEKIEVASESGIKKVMIASGSASYSVGENETLNLTAYGKDNLSLEVVEVMDLDQVLFHLTDLDLNHKNITVLEDAAYTQIMRELSEALCRRTEKIEQELAEKGVELDEALLNSTTSKKEKAFNATREGDFYSAASYCFGANIQLKNNYYQAEEVTKLALVGLFKVLERKIISLEEKIALEKIETISDLQALMVVKERLNDVKEQIDKFTEQVNEQSEDELASILAYAEERYFSALSWSEFFNMEGKKFILDTEQLSESCLKKISEAEERHQYTSLFLGGGQIQHIWEKITLSRTAFDQEEYEFCLIKAAQAKAEANAILSSMGLQPDNLPDFLDGKSKAVERVIAENSAEGVFPILGYSYYQYANSLKEMEPFTALMYLEYALEMSDLGIYFLAEDVVIEIPLAIDERWWYLVGGVVLGLLLGYYLFRIDRQKERRIRKKIHKVLKF